MSPHLPSPAPTLLEIELAGERLLATVALSCAPDAGFPAQLELTLGAVLAEIAAEPEPSYLLTDRAGSRRALERQYAWRDILAARLRAAANRGPGLSGPEPLVERLLIAGVQSQVRRALYDGGSGRLLDLLPDLTQIILAYCPAAAAPAGAVSAS